MPLPERIAALPSYIPEDFKDAAPGHRFQLYLEHWQGQTVNSFAPYKKSPTQGLGKDEKAIHTRESAAVLKDLCSLPRSSVETLKGIRARQQALLTHYGANGYRISTSSTAPFATGLGNEHPIENGFAFLTPYGLPYLAGSGVKGILRRAAEELALQNETQQPDDWTWLAIWCSFGFEGAVDKGSLWDAASTLGQAFARDLPKTAAQPDIYALIRSLFAGSKEGTRFLDTQNQGAEQFLRACMAGKSLRGGLQSRGSLDFWDVFPNPASGKLTVEIMTPHYSKYYQGEETPHDSGAPVPVSFLAVPAKSQFDFHVICHPSRLPESLKNQWRVLLDRAFQHAFEWVGFGAKTSVGYGAMADVAAWSPTVATSGSAATANTSGTATASSGTATQTWPTAKLTLNPGNGEIKASFETQTTVGLKGVDADRLRAALGEERANKLKKNKELKGVSVEVEPQGNALQLKGLSPT